tara:strand:+ start:850 stop:2853 length:2004 start_codon:yes stop_codon:yes gene_type:complete
MKTSRSYFSSSIEAFMSASENEVLGQLTSSENVFDITPKTTYAWQGEISVLKSSLSDTDGFIHFEYVIPRMGKRADVLLVIDNVLFIIEFKVGSNSYDKSSVTQLIDYALDLKNFHEGSHNKIVCPVLVATDACEEECNTALSADLIYEPILSNGKNLNQLMQRVLSASCNLSPKIVHADWLASAYKPTPNIIEAAQALYEGHSVDEISRSDAGATNLTITSDEIGKIIIRAKEEGQKAICFVTGVPGAGKTLVGLNIATDKSESIGVGKETVFLSGNGPLVTVLSEALARNKVTKAKAKGEFYRKTDARREVKKFIQNIHHFRDDNLEGTNAPYEKVVIFDESQRAWDQNKLQAKMKEKGHKIKMSEPDLLISVMNRHDDWCVIICLVGGGQEINSGEAGISTWIESMDTKYGDWKVYISDQIRNPEYSWDYDFDGILSSQRTTISKQLHLSVSLRSFRSENLSNYINEVVAGNVDGARALVGTLGDYPLYVTRSLPDAKAWLRENARGSERYGLVAEANAIRLKPDGIFVKSEIDPANWFLASKDDVRSSFYLEDVATEYDVQGLELDWVCVCWDASLRRINNDWELYKFVGTKFQKRLKRYQRRYLINAYRVLLTRARQGLIIFVPEGDRNDKTRDPSFYNGTYDYLIDCGFAEVKIDVERHIA